MHVELPAKLLNCLLRSNKSNINQFGVSLFIYVGLHTSTRKYEDIACRSWEYMHTCIDLLRMFMGQIQSFKQCYVYNDIQIDVCFEIQKDPIHIQPIPRVVKFSKALSKLKAHPLHTIKWIPESDMLFLFWNSQSFHKFTPPYGGGFTFDYTKHFLNRFVLHVHRARPTHGPWTGSKTVRIWPKIE